MVLRVRPSCSAFVLALLVGACTRPASPPPPSPPPPPPLAAGPRDPLAVDAPALRRDDPRGARAIAHGPLAYLRFVTRPFGDVLCSRYAEAVSTMPTVYVVGNAHLEQYAVAADGRGLADFDAAALGPPVIDLARFATSLVLAVPNDASAGRGAVEALLHGYAKGLDEPSAPAAEPAAIARLRSRFEPTAASWLDHVERTFPPTAPQDAEAQGLFWTDFATLVHGADASTDPAYFKVKSSGRLSPDRVIARVDGPTPAAEDDVVVEAREVAAGSFGSCIRPSDFDGARGRATQMGPRPQRFVAAVDVRGTPFFSHALSPNYTELRVQDIRSSAELAEVAEDAGRDLAKIHGAGSDVTPALKRALEWVGPGLASNAIELAAHVTRAWKGYLKESNQVAWTRGSRPGSSGSSAPSAPSPSSAPSAGIHDARP